MVVLEDPCGAPLQLFEVRLTSRVDLQTLVKLHLIANSILSIYVY